MFSVNMHGWSFLDSQNHSYVSYAFFLSDVVPLSVDILRALFTRHIILALTVTEEQHGVIRLYSTWPRPGAEWWVR